MNTDTRSHTSSPPFPDLVLILHERWVNAGRQARQDALWSLGRILAVPGAPPGVAATQQARLLSVALLEALRLPGAALVGTLAAYPLEHEPRSYRRLARALLDQFQAFEQTSTEQDDDE